MDKELLGKIGVLVVGFLLFVGFMSVSDNNITGYAIGINASPSTINIGFALIILAMIIFLIYFMTGGNAKEIFKTLLGSFSIFAGFYLINKLVKDPNILIAILSLTFGVMAMIWVLNAHSVLSKGSSLRSYTTSFFFCLLFIVLFSIYDTLISVLDIQPPYIYIKHILITVSYIIFVNTSYRMYKIGKEFGFSSVGKEITKQVQSNVKKPAKKA